MPIPKSQFFEKILATFTHLEPSIKFLSYCLWCIDRNIEGKVKFACIDGPEFDGHKVDFNSLIKRMNTYREEEKNKYEEMKKTLGEVNE